MKKNIFNPLDSSEILERMEDLNPSNQKVSGALGLDETLTILMNQLKIAVGEKITAVRGSFLHHTVLKKMALWGVPVTSKEDELPELITEEKGDYYSFEDHKNALIELILEMPLMGANHKWGNHPIYGHLTRVEWGRLLYMQLDQRLKQFGV